MLDNILEGYHKNERRLQLSPCSRRGEGIRESRDRHFLKASCIEIIAKETNRDSLVLPYIQSQHLYWIAINTSHAGYNVIMALY